MTSFAEICAAMGPTYILETKAEFDDRGNPVEPTRCILRDSTKDAQYGICISQAYREPKFRISGQCAVSSNGESFPHDGTPTISCGIVKSAKQIAADIKRRLLSEYDDVFEKAIVDRNVWNDYHEKKGKNKQVLMELMGSCRDYGDDIDVPMGLPDRVDRIGYIHTLKASAIAVEIDFRSVPFDKAVKLLEFWKSLDSAD